jgi:hypothetical protein
MAKQTFTTGQVLTAAQMTSLQQTAMLGGAASTKTASYTLVAADAGTAISMSNASATTITVNTGLFADGDTIQITNIGAGVCTITAGTATVNTASSLALAQWESGTLDFRSASAAVFYKAAGAAAGGGGKVLQVVQATYATEFDSTSATYVDSGLTASITPSLATSKVLVIVSQAVQLYTTAGNTENKGSINLVRGATEIVFKSSDSIGIQGASSTLHSNGSQSFSYLDSPSTTSSTTYKTQQKRGATNTTIRTQNNSSLSTIILLEIGA